MGVRGWFTEELPSATRNHLARATTTHHRALPSYEYLYRPTPPTTITHTYQLSGQGTVVRLEPDRVRVLREKRREQREIRVKERKTSQKRKNPEKRIERARERRQRKNRGRVPNHIWSPCGDQDLNQSVTIHQELQSVTIHQDLIINSQHQLRAHSQLSSLIITHLDLSPVTTTYP